MEDEKDAYYVVRKGDIVGVYRSLNDFQSLLCGPDVAVFKGYRLSTVAENYLTARGLSGAIYSIGISNVEGALFGHLTPCPFQQPNLIKDKVCNKIPSEKKKKDVGSTSLSEAPQRNFPETESFIEALPVSAHCCSCILEFDGAAKGNPGPAGAGVVLRAVDGSLVYRLREGLGVATNNVAEYRAAILGLRYALDRGFRHIRVHGDSKLVCMQEYNSEADAQANLGVYLQNGEVQEEVDRR